jgi:hypothetical protein
MSTIDTRKPKYAEIARQIRELPPEKPCSSYKWEELVYKLCASSDDGLHAIGIRERDILLQTYSNLPVFVHH